MFHDKPRTSTLEIENYTSHPNAQNSVQALLANFVSASGGVTCTTIGNDDLKWLTENHQHKVPQESNLST